MESRTSGTAPTGGSASPQHPDQHRSERPVLLAVDQRLGEGAALRVAPELADPFGALEVGEAEDAEDLGASGRREGLEALAERRLHLLEGRMWTLMRLRDGSFEALALGVLGPGARRFTRDSLVSLLNRGPASAEVHR
jgi:hypothetical protein